MAELVEIQQKLDKRKWLESQELGADKSGKMPYCDKCKYQSTLNSNCTICQEEREYLLACARAYKKRK